MSIFSKWFSNKEFESPTTAEPQKPRLSASDYCEQGQKSLDAGKYVEAMEFFQAAIEADKRFEKAYLLLASAYERQGKMDNAKATLYGLLAIDPNNESALESLKRIEELNGQVVLATENQSLNTGASNQTVYTITNSQVINNSGSSKHTKTIKDNGENGFAVFLRLLIGAAIVIGFDVLLIRVGVTEIQRWGTLLFLLDLIILVLYYKFLEFLGFW